MGIDLCLFCDVIDYSNCSNYEYKIIYNPNSAPAYVPTSKPIKENDLSSKIGDKD